ncbi:serine hydrolase [Streptomyces sp. NPDC058374]|uniref:serine hydrolase n=1 Tax=Streptomyces sp. NPDC058374 TaxID=3346466 RepID=UPI003648E8D6
MAGEFPDRSEQKKAAGDSGTPATDAPAPATDDRDPRIAVARETPDRTDQATAVFRTDGARDEGAKEAAGEAGGSVKGEDAEGEADGSAEGGGGRDESDAVTADADADADAADVGPADAQAGTDGRLRDAVAAWVATDESVETGKSGGDGAGSADADSVDDATEGEKGPGGASGASGESARGAGGPKVPGAREAGDSERGPAEVKGAGDAAEADDADDTDAEAQADEDAPEPGGGAKGDSADESAAEGQETEAAGSGEPEDAAESVVKKDGGRAAVPGQGGKPDAEAEPEKAAEADEAAEAAEAAEAGKGEAEGVEEGAAAVVSTGVKLRKVQKGKGEGEGVDQPTAVFRAPKSAPEVDQPTTMLKVGDGKAKEAEPEKGAGSPSESEAERTSKFVPLRGLEGPAAIKPKARPAAPQPEEEAEADAEPRAKAVPPPAPAADETAALPAAERTTQQPLPPLDLLAELTNTPPPPETPMRTAVRRVKIWTPLAILLLIVFAVVQAVRPLPAGTLALTAEETYTFKGDKPSMPWPTEGQAMVTVDGIGSLGSYGEQKPIPIGSVAKVMTAYTILREHPVKKGTEGEKLTIDAKAQQDYENAGQESTVKVTEGQKISVKEAIEAIMLPSANNIARQLARWDSDGDESAFVEKMNKYAAELGMENTTYTDPSGLKETTVSSAADQVKLGKAVMEFEAFSSVVRLPSYESTTSGRPEKNYNFLVPMYGVVGIKTGSTTKAGGNLLFAAEKVVDGEKQLIIGAVFGQHATPILDTATARSKDLILRTQELLTSEPVVKKGDVVGHVDDGLGSTTPVVATKDVPAVGWPGLTVKLALDDGGKALPHEAKAGTEVGVLSVGDGTGDAVEVPIALQSDLAEPSFGARLQRIG